MSAIVRLPMPVADVEPGASISLDVLVRNTGTVVDQFNFEVLGPAGTWATFDPPTVSLFPQGEETIKSYLFSTPGGRHRLGLVALRHPGAVPRRPGRHRRRGGVSQRCRIQRRHR